MAKNNAKTHKIKWAYVYIAIGVYTGICGHIYRCMWECIHGYVGIYVGVCGNVYTGMWAYI